MPFHTDQQDRMKWLIPLSHVCSSYQEHLKTCPIRKVVVRLMPLI